MRKTKENQKNQENEKAQNKDEKNKNKINEENKIRKEKINLNKLLTEEEKKRNIIEKQKEYNIAMAKRRNYDKEYLESEIKNRTKKIEELKLKNKLDKKIYIYLLISLLLFFLLFIYFSNPGKFNIKRFFENKEIEKIKKEYLSEDERKKIIKEKLRLRKANFDAFILKQENAAIFPEEFTIDYFIKNLYEEKLLIKDIDEVKDNYIFIGSSHFLIDDLSIIYKDKYLKNKYKTEIKELINLDEENPNIIFVRKFGIYNKDGELIVNVVGGKPQNFDGFVDTRSNPIVIAYDKKDGDLTDKMTFTPKLENLEAGKSYTLTYTITNSREKTTTKEFKIKCIEMARKK